MTSSKVRLAPLLLGGLLVALAVPPLMEAAAGGGELALGSLRLAFYDLPAAVFCLLGLVLWLGRRSRGGPVESWLSALSLVGLGVVCSILWSPPRGLPEWLEVRPGKPLIAGGLFLGLSALAGRLGRRLLPSSHLPGIVTIALALLAGVGLHTALVSADRAALGERLGAPALTPLLSIAASPDSRSHPNLLLIVVDTLRADALDVADELPFFSALAADSLVFERAIAPAPWTVPSMMALMTGRYPSSFDPQGRGAPWPGGLSDARPLHSAVPRLAELLSAAGYSTAAFVKNPFLAGGLGLDQGFAVYERVHGDTAEHGSAGQLVNAALRWSEAMTSSGAQPSEVPWFLYLHFMDPHVNYQPPASQLSPRSRDYEGEINGRASTLHRMIEAAPEPEAADVTQLKDLYAGEVRYLDEQLGWLFAELTEVGLLDAGTCVVVTADHGEQFGEHQGWLHGDIYTENVRVPLMLRGPGVSFGRRQDPASLVDLLPTLGAWLDLPSLAQGDGRNLLDPGASGSAKAVHTEYGELTRLTGARFSLLRRADGSTTLYDLNADPGEHDDLAESHAEVVTEMLGVMEAHAARPPLDLPQEPSAQVGEGGGNGESDLGSGLDTEALRAIGYIDG